MGLSDLVRRIIAGDRDAETEFVDRYARGVNAMVRHACSDRSAVEDLCQDVLKTVLEKIRTGSLRDPERLSGFVASLARNLVIGHGRRLGSRPAAATLSATADLRDASPGPLEQLLDAERAALVRRVLDQLPTARDREILRRFYIENQDKDEICAALDLTREHFNRVLFRARERYREGYRTIVSSRRDKRTR